jgi:dGTPase
MTHAIEVAQVAVSIARPLRLNVALVEAAAIGHDCGHGPGGHASEGALSSFVEGGYHHAVYGADVVLAPLNLCVETLDAIRNHSWNRDTPATPEGEVVAWADRIAYVCHDFEDAVNAQVVRPDDLPPAVREIIGTDRRTQLHRLITSMTHASADAGIITMGAAEASALAAFREFNFDRIYLRPESVDQAERVASVITSLTAYFADHPDQVEDGMIRAADADALATAVRYVSGMTDRYLLRVASQLLGWDDSKLPTAIV